MASDTDVTYAKGARHERVGSWELRGGGGAAGAAAAGKADTNTAEEGNTAVPQTGAVVTKITHTRWVQADG